jgi:hypothetical protein
MTMKRYFSLIVLALALAGFVAMPAYAARTRLASNFQSDITIAYDHGSTTATTAVKLYKVPAGKSLKVTSVDYVNPTGLATDAANIFSLSVRNGATLATVERSNNSSGGSAFVADAWNDIALHATAANSVFAAGDTVSFVMTETGTATLPVGRVVIHAKFI